MTQREFLSDFEDLRPVPIAAEPASMELLRLARQLPETVRLGTSSWSFPGWKGIVWAKTSPTRFLSTQGLTAYAKHPIFRTVGIDRGYYRALTEKQFSDFAGQVPEDFRFLVKAPQSVTDSVLRTERGIPAGPNPTYLDLDCVRETFLEPLSLGLGVKSGSLVFEMSPIPGVAKMDLEAKKEHIRRLVDFLGNLPKALHGVSFSYAVELRSPELLTPRFIDGLRETGVRLAIGIHPKMPDAQRQILALKRLDAPGTTSGDWMLKGDITIRWSLSKLGTYTALKRDWAPFSQLQSPDLVSRQAIVWLLKRAIQSGVRATVVANNKAEGCAPLTIRAIAQSLVEQLKIASDL